MVGKNEVWELFFGMYNRLHVNVHSEYEPQIYGTGKRIGIFVFTSHRQMG